MKTSLSYILPAHKACEILGEATVRRIVSTLLHARTKGLQVTPNVTRESPDGTGFGKDNTNATPQEELWEEELEQIVQALMYVPNQLPHGATRASNRNSPAQASAVAATTIPTPPVIAQSWKKLTTQGRIFGLDKNLLFRFVLPNVAQPHSGPQGHMGLFDCWVYTLQGHATTSTATSYYGGAASQMVWIPDVLIFLAICQEYHHLYFQERAAVAGNPIEQHQQQQDDNGKEENDGSNSGSSSGSGSGGSEDDDEEEKIRQARRLKQRQHECIKTMAKLSYRFYDSYQKKGTLARDTLHRFLTDVYGEDSYKTIPMRQLLDAIFRPLEKDNNNAAASSSPADAASPNSPPPATTTSTNIPLSEALFLQRILETTPSLEAQRILARPHTPHTSKGHVLLDWIALLGSAMVPPEELPQSTTAYLETMQVHPQPIVHQYLLAETRLYEIKRRFHSLVESSALIIQGDPMATANEEENNEESKDNNNNNNNNSNNDPKPSVPKHVITQSAFENAVTRSNADMGFGGYLPPRLARLVFHAVLKGSGSAGVMMNADDDDDEDDDNNNNNDYNDAMDVDDDHQTKKNGKNRRHHHGHKKSKSSKAYWGLYHVLKFGCEAVRLSKEVKTLRGKPKKITPRERDMALLRQVFSMFANVCTTTASSGTPRRLTKDPLNSRVVLDRPQIGAMLLLLLEHAQFRLQRDAPPDMLDDTSCTGHDDEDEDTLDASDETYVSASACALLGLLPPMDNPPAPSEQVSLKALVDYVLGQAKGNSKQTGNPEEDEAISFEEFCHWHYSYGASSDKREDEKPKIVTSSQTRRLGPLMLELRLIASVLFGIPPTLASQELTLIAELQRRHGHRYPKTEVCRRGPKGTVWYLINFNWYQNWATLVNRVAQSVDDAGDGRSDSSSMSSRNLPKINNTNLLADGGSLALRADIRWGTDYEICVPLAWSALQAWYDGGPPIHRTVVPYVASSATSPHSKKQPKMRTEMEIELYPFFVTVFLCDAASRGEARPFQQYVPISRVSPIRVVLLQLAKGLSVDPDLCRLWVMGTESDSTAENADTDWLLNLDKNIVEQRDQRRHTHPGSTPTAGGEAGGITLLLELQDEESGMWPRGNDGRRRSYLERLWQQKGADEPEMGDGVVGLYNMG